MKSKLLCLLAVCVHAISVRGSLGDTSEQAAARYGKSVDTDFLLDERVPTERGTLYHRDGIDIFVYFEGGVSVLERHQRHEKMKFSQEEVDALLAENGHGATWNVKGSAANITRYFATPSAGEKLLATWLHGERTRSLVVSTEKYDAARNDVIARSKALQAQ